jgi:hypothetical protein
MKDRRGYLYFVIPVGGAARKRILISGGTDADIS